MAPLDAASGWDCHVHVFEGVTGAGTGAAKGHYAPQHYAPQHYPLEAIESLAHNHGFGHLVLVQPSVYGTDNSVMLAALRAHPGRHRAVAVVDVAVSDAELTGMHLMGVRGVRFNLVSPVGNNSNTATDFARLAPRLQALGWHVQWYARPDDLPAIAALHQRWGVPAVLDHLAGLHANLAADAAAWQALHTLAALGAWVKLSGWYRLRADAPYTALDNNIARIARLFAGHMVWGSDWPHTSFSADCLPGYISTLEPLNRVLTEAQKTDALQLAPGRLYA
jgi:predicted TIM-barrel fold metal-dependent hydrolase